MRARCKRKEARVRGDADTGAELRLPPETPGAETHTPVFPKKGAKCSVYDDDKVYLGVRVKMPVRDLLKNIRKGQGWIPKEVCGEVVKDKKRVKTHSARHRTKRKGAAKSLEELAIIIEVLEEDLKTGNCLAHPPVSPKSSSTGYTSDDFDEMIPSPETIGTFSPGTGNYHQVPSPPDFVQHALPLPTDWNHGDGDVWFDPSSPSWNLSDSSFFWAQVQREESHLSEISDAVLLNPDKHGKTALHQVAGVGKRALGYCLASRMAALDSLDLKDSDGMTALLHAAKHNHHLMVADLIRFGASVNAVNNAGKSCLHLSAERGYIRVLEVLKHAMMDGVYVDVEATDNSGMSVLQCASVALKAAVRELENCEFPHQARLQSLRQEQMMETLECLLQMGSYLHTMGSQSMQPVIG
ncbi:uncharacterized protein LOC142895132 [Nelusetta ayraudi]|uniref:uncharacterized protein LOC142895132 n=1 Tax=Nelusetta ayraudi TaxID=303726 RepID=UPI003F70D26F